jgi:3-oxoacyl-[acyl-carrier protein] reductase
MTPASADPGADSQGNRAGQAGPDSRAGQAGPEQAGGGRVVLVTGGSKGIGSACVEWFLANGDRVATTHRSSAPFEPSGQPDEDHYLSISCDVTDAAQVEAAFAAVEAAWGPVEVLVANAGVTRDTLIMRMSDDAWDEVIATNLTGAFRVARRGVSKMLRLHRGRIIFVSSIGAFTGSPGQANYGASKAGMVGMARSLAREVGSRGITVNVVAPGMVDTDMLAAVGDARMAELAASVPLGRLATPDDVAEAVGYLAGPGAGYVTGVVLAVDGGLGMGL